MKRAWKCYELQFEFLLRATNKNEKITKASKWCNEREKMEKFEIFDESWTCKVVKGSVKSDIEFPNFSNF